MATSERPRVLQMGPDPSVGGGMSVAIASLLDSELGRLYRLEFLATYEGRAPLRRLAVFARALLLLALWSLRRRGRLVHVHATVRGSAVRKSLCVLVAKGLGRRVLLHVHSGAGDIATYRAAAGGPTLLLIRAALDRADRVAVVSEASGAALRAAGYGGELIVLPNPAPSVGAPDPARRTGPPEALYLGGFANPVKGGEVLVAALARLAERVPDLRVTLAGPGSPPPALGELERDHPGIRWVGWLDPEAKEAALLAASIFVLPSLSEGMPMALLEAMAYETAIVAARAGGIPELVESGRDALLVEPGDAEGLADALATLLGDGDLRERLARAAGEEARRLGPDRVAAEVAAVYRSLL